MSYDYAREIEDATAAWPSARRTKAAVHGKYIWTAKLVGNNQLTNLTACVHANEWAIRKGTQQ